MATTTNHYMGQLLDHPKTVPKVPLGTATNPDVIDLSNYDISSNIDYSQIKGVGANSIIVKTSEYTNYKDTQASSHISKGMSAGLKVHGYHFYQGGGGVAEANWAVSCAKSQGLPDGAYLFLDFENSSVGGDWTQQTLDFANVVKSAGFKAGFYSGEYLASSKVNITTLKSNGLYIWIANYSTRPTVQHDMWQFTSAFNLPKYTQKTVDASIDFTGQLNGVTPPPEFPQRQKRPVIKSGDNFGITQGRVSISSSSKNRIVIAPDGIHIEQSDIDDTAFTYLRMQNKNKVNYLVFIDENGALKTKKE